MRKANRAHDSTLTSLHTVCGLPYLYLPSPFWGVSSDDLLIRALTSSNFASSSFFCRVSSALRSSRMATFSSTLASRTLFFSYWDQRPVNQIIGRIIKMERAGATYSFPFLLRLQPSPVDCPSYCYGGEDAGIEPEFPFRYLPSMASFWSRWWGGWFRCNA